MGNIEERLFGEWVKISGEAAVETFMEFLRDVDWKGRVGYFENLLRIFQNRIQSKTHVMLEKNDGLVSLAERIGEGYIGVYLAGMLSELKEKRPDLLEIPPGVTMEEYYDFLRWVSHQYGRPEEYFHHSRDRVINLIVKEYWRDK